MVTFDATALVVPFEQLRMTDVEAVGGKNASLGEMISQLSQRGVRVPEDLAVVRERYSPEAVAAQLRALYEGPT